jgi:catechol 2,3-dioxygenase-like lactoylglutathione lyase family enzyme
MTATHVFAGIPVADYPAAVPWYERLFGRPADMHPHDSEAAWQLAGAGWVYVVQDPDRAGTALLTLLVDDIDAVLAGLAERGLEPGAVEELSNGVRKAAFADPEGNRITFGQPPNT